MERKESGISPTAIFIGAGFLVGITLVLIYAPMPPVFGPSEE